MVRDAVREAIIASLQQATNPTVTTLDAATPISPTPMPTTEPLSRFEMLDLAILKKYSTK